MDADPKEIFDIFKKHYALAFPPTLNTNENNDVEMKEFNLKRGGNLPDNNPASKKMHK